MQLGFETRAPKDHLPTRVRKVSARREEALRAWREQTTIARPTPIPWDISTLPAFLESDSYSKRVHAVLPDERMEALAAVWKEKFAPQIEERERLVERLDEIEEEIRRLQTEKRDVDTRLAEHGRETAALFRTELAAALPPGTPAYLVPPWTGDVRYVPAQLRETSVQAAVNPFLPEELRRYDVPPTVNFTFAPKDSDSVLQVIPLRQLGYADGRDSQWLLDENSPAVRAAREAAEKANRKRAAQEKAKVTRENNKKKQKR